MKKEYTWASALVFSLIGCTPSVTDEAIPTTIHQYPVQFAIHLNEEVLPFSKTRSMPPCDLPEPTLKNESEEPTETPSDAMYTHLNYIVYSDDAPNQAFKHRAYQIDDKNIDFGVVYDTLPAGNYKLVFLAHSSTTSTLTNNQMAFEQISDMFHSVKTIKIPDPDKTADIELRRIVSKIIFISSDAIPTEASHFEIKLTPYSHILNVWTGYSIANQTTETFTYPLSSQQTGQTTIGHEFFTLIPEENTTIHALLSTFDNANDILRQREINISPIANQIIRYTGHLYSPPGADNQFTLDILNGGKWDNITDTELPD